MFYKLELLANQKQQQQEYRKTQSANKCRGTDSPNRIYQNLSHKNASQPKVVNLFRNNPLKSNHYLQTSIDVHEMNKPKKVISSHYRIKTETDQQVDLNRRFYPNEIQQLMNKIEAQKNKLNALNKCPIVKRAVRVQQRRETYDCDRSKQPSQPDIVDQITQKTNNFIKNQQTAVIVENQPQFNYFLYRADQNKRKNPPRSDDVSPIRRSIYQQIQDYSDTKMDQINNSKEEEIMQFSFGMQYTKSRALRKFPKDIFYGDVRKAKKNLSMQL